MEFPFFFFWFLLLCTLLLFHSKSMSPDISGRFFYGPRCTKLEAMILRLLGICSKMVAQSVDPETGQQSFLGSTSSCPLGPNSRRRKHKHSFIPHSIKFSSGAQTGDPPTPDSTSKLHDPWADFKYVFCTDFVCLFTYHDHF